jgi:hypothetical protein
VPQETQTLIFETHQGEIVALQTIPDTNYPLMSEFASEQIRWLNGGHQPRLIMKD